MTDSTDDVDWYDPPDDFDHETEWRTAAGKVIKVRNMEDGHLMNTIRFVIKRKEKEINMYLRHPPTFSGEMAQASADDGYEEAMNSDPEDEAADEFPGLFEEARRRKLME